ncbi:MAG: N-acetylmuramic acid 6-phosphate etherase [Saprospiraceae bacterium]|nr:N-acetylmuramic acid 6-phosphate etherase [Saprospiraceae bacterium]
MKITEQDSHYHNLEQQSVRQLTEWINQEDQKVAPVVRDSIPQIVPLIESIIPKMEAGGRLFYIGAGTSGRLGILDASECPPTFGVPDNWVIGIIAGGDGAIRKAVEHAEDDDSQAWKDLRMYAIDDLDTVVGIAASGTTPYVVGGLRDCRSNGITTGCVTCNPDTPVAQHSDFPVEVIVGPEFVTGSTRMKSGTAQKMVLNMITTSVMIRLGRVKDNKMVDMQLSNNKLVERGIRLVGRETGLSLEKSKEMLIQHGSVRKAIEAWNKQL